MAPTAPRRKVEEVVSQEVVDGLSALCRQMRRQKLPPGMTRERLATLTVIDERGPISVSDLAASLQVRHSTMSRMVSSLVNDGLAKRRSSPSDGRGVLISLTPAGRRACRIAGQQSLEQIRQSLEKLSDQQIEVLAELALAMRDSAD